MTSEAYWKKRARECEAYWHEKSEELVKKELADQYEKALYEIHKSIAAFYAQFADENGMTMQQARRLLRGQKYRVWRKSMEDYLAEIEKTGDKGLLRELNTLAMRSRISPLDKLYGETLMELDKLGRDVSDRMRSFLTDAYKDNYYRGLFEIGHAGKLLPAVHAVSDKKVEDVLRAHWSGKNYSQRVWKNTAKLGKKLEQVMTDAVHRGADVQEMAKQVAPYLRNGYGLKSAERLVQTELNYVQNEAALASIKDAGMKYFRFIAILDTRTTVICREHDGQIYSVDDADVGYNQPPLHVRCRSTIAASFGEGKDSRKGSRMARDTETGKSVRVPAAMTYQDFDDVFIAKKKTLSEWQNEHENGIIKIGGNYSCDLAMAVGKQHYDSAMKILDSCPDDDAKVVWNSNEEHIRIDDVHFYKKQQAFACGNRITLNIDYVSQGSNISEPYQTLFHESGHAIDSLAGRTGIHFSTKFKDGAFAKAIHKDVDDRVKAVAKKLKPEFEKQFKLGESAAREWLLKNGCINFSREYGAQEKWSKKFAYKYVANEIIKSGDKKVYGNVSDICEGATNGKIYCGIGHIPAEKTYWKKRTFQIADSEGNLIKVEDGLSTEAFAEFFDSTVANQESLELIKKYFPSAYDVFKEMLKELAKEGMK